MSSIPCALVVALFVSLAIAAPTDKKPVFDTMRMEQQVSAGDMDQFIVVFGVSPCMAACLDSMRPGFNETDTDVKNDDDPQAKFDDICDNYLAAADCFRKCPDGDDHLFDVISAGANFMCVEQRAAFERAMPCIHEQKKFLKKECRQKCNISDDSDMEGQSTRATKVPSASESGNFGQSGNSSEFFEHVGELCDMLHCSIECGRDFLNEHCDKDLHAGSLLTEVIIRPLEKNAQFMQEMQPDFEEQISEALPKQCFFIVDEKQLNELRGGFSFPDNEIHSNKSHSVTRSPATSTVSFDDNQVRPKESHVNKFPAKESTTSSTTKDLQHIRQRRSYSSSNLIASSGVFASHAMAYFM